VECAASVQEALHKFAELVPDVLVGDIGMPEEDGLSLIRKVRTMEQEKNLPSCAAIALTAFAMAADRAKCLEAGYNRHMAKPVSVQDLIEGICSLTEHILCGVNSERR